MSTSRVVRGAILREAARTPPTDGATIGCASTQLILEVWGGTCLADEQTIRRLLLKTAEACHASPLQLHLHRFSAANGLSGVVIIAESHISIHTWPEFKYAAIDIFMCGTIDPGPAVQVIKALLKPRQLQLVELKRGMFMKPMTRRGSSP